MSFTVTFGSDHVGTFETLPVAQYRALELAREAFAETADGETMYEELVDQHAADVCERGVVSSDCWTIRVVDRARQPCGVRVSTRALRSDALVCQYCGSRNHGRVCDGSYECRDCETFVNTRGALLATWGEFLRSVDSDAREEGDIEAWMREGTGAPRCASCGGRRSWCDPDWWVCDDCGDEWPAEDP